MWVRFWCSVESENPPLDIDDDKFIWVSNRETNESLNEWARELVPNWVDGLDRSFFYGYEKLEILPDVIKNRLIKEHEQRIADSNLILQILKGP